MSQTRTHCRSLRRRPSSQCRSFRPLFLAAANRQKSRHGRNLEECDKSRSLLRHFSTAARRKRWKRASTPEADRSKLPVQADRTLSSVLFEIMFENFHQNFQISCFKTTNVQVVIVQNCRCRRIVHFPMSCSRFWRRQIVHIPMSFSRLCKTGGSSEHFQMSCF